MEQQPDDNSTIAGTLLHQKTDTTSSHLFEELPDNRTQEERAKEEARDLIEYQKYLANLKLQELRARQDIYRQLLQLQIRKDNEDIITLNIEGSEHSTRALHLILSEFLKDRVLHCLHIYNSIHDEKYNWRYQKDYVIDEYRTKLITSLPPDQGIFAIQDTDGYYKHHIEQIHHIAMKNQSSFLFSGYFGLKMQTLLPKYLNRGVDFLLSESEIPTVLIKDGNLRGEKNTGYKWLILMDRASSDCFKILDVFLPLIDLSRDFIYGLTLIPPYIAFDDIKKQFAEKMQELNLREDQYCYQSEEYKKKPSDIVKEIVNHNHEHYFDFVMFYNNPNKYRVEREKSESCVYVNKLASNICFANKVYYKESKLKDEDKDELIE